MRIPLWIVGLCTLAPGCSLVGTATDTVTSESRRYLEDCAEAVRDRRWAAQAWEDARAAAPPGTYSEDHADGFKAGFADHLRAGGTGEPPPLPPKRYWGLRYQTPEGSAAIQDWFAGFRHGAAVARDGGYRRWVTFAPPQSSPPGLAPVSAVPEPVPPAELPPAEPPSIELPAPRRAETLPEAAPTQPGAQVSPPPSPVPLPPAPIPVLPAQVRRTSGQ
jgi:hypothetical protein